MRRWTFAAITLICLLFLGSLAALDQFDAGQEVAPPHTTGVGSESMADTRGQPSPTPAVASPRAVSPEIQRQLDAPPTAPAPAPAPAALPPSGAPPAPPFVREKLGDLVAHVTARCGRLELRLGDELRQAGRQPEGQAVLLLDLEPQDGQAKIFGSTLQSPGSTRSSLVACAQLHLKGLVIPVSHLRRGGRTKVQVVLGVAE